jgi:hypothetical protein
MKITLGELLITIGLSLGLIIWLLCDAGYIGRVPKVGEQYVFVLNPNPFYEHSTNTIVEVKEGWVLCVDQHNITNSMTLTTFRHFHHKVK